MTWAHLHIALNHVPVIGVPVGVALLVYAAVRRSREVETAARWLLVVVALAALPVYWTGEPTEDIVGGMAGVSDDRIEAHEEAAPVALAVTLALGVLACVSLWLSARRGPAPAWLRVGTVLWGLAAVILLARTANLGGQIRHEEIRSEVAAPAADHDD